MKNYLIMSVAILAAVPALLSGCNHRNRQNATQSPSSETSAEGLRPFFTNDAAGNILYGRTSSALCAPSADLEALSDSEKAFYCLRKACSYSGGTFLEEKKECRCDALHAFRSENSTGRCLEKKVLRDPQFGGFRTGVSRFFDSNEVVEGGTIIPIWDSTLPQESEEIFRLGIGLLAADVNWGGRSMVQYSKNAPNLAETLVAAAFAYRLDGESMANPIATGAIPPALWEGNILFVAPALGAVEVLESLKENDRIDFESFKKPRRMANDPTYSDFLKGIETAYKVFRNTETFEFTEFKLKGLAGCAESCLLKMPLEIIASDDLNSYLLVRYDYGAISYQGIHLSQTVGDITRRAVLVLNAAKTVSFLDLIEARAVPKTRKINEAHVVFDRYGNLVTKMQRQTLRSEYEKSLW